MELTKKYLCIQLSNVDKPTFRYAGSAGDAAYSHQLKEEDDKGRLNLTC